MLSNQALSTAPVFLLLFVIVACWFWWSWPHRRVPADADKAKLERLEAEDKFRQTVGQLIGGLALIATFALTIYQTFESGRQWREDSNARAIQNRNQRFTEAVKLLAPTSGNSSTATITSDTTAHVAALYALHSLAMEDPQEYEVKLIEILQTHVARLAKTDRVKEAGLSNECKVTDEKAKSDNREDPDPEIQAAMNLLGFRKNDWQLPPKSHFGLIRLERLFLDDLDLDGADLRGSSVQGAMLSNSYFRRVNFRESNLESADFRGSVFADWENPGYPKLGTVNSRWLYTDASHGGEQEWRRYRCWVTDFRGANLKGADFSSSKLGGANFRGAIIDKDTKFTKADISRAYFVGTSISEEQVKSACGGEQPWLPPELEKKGVSVAPCD